MTFSGCPELLQGSYVLSEPITEGQVIWNHAIRHSHPLLFNQSQIVRSRIKPLHYQKFPLRGFSVNQRRSCDTNHLPRHFLPVDNQSWRQLNHNESDYPPSQSFQPTAFSAQNMPRFRPNASIQLRVYPKANHSPNFKESQIISFISTDL